MTKKRKSDRKATPSQKPEPSRKKTWVFRIFSAVFIPTLLLGILEMGLRLAGFGYPTRLIMEREIDGKTICIPNSHFFQRFFPKGMARTFDDGFVFEKNTPHGTFRIFTLGASAALGYPAPRYNFGRCLEVMLNDMYPGTKFEVYNAATTAINSHVVREIADGCAQYDPDLFIVYLGNNEVVGPYGSGTVLTRTPPSMPLIRANLAVKSTRVGQLYEDLASFGSARGAPPQAWEGMAMFTDKQVRYDSNGMQQVYRNFEKNLQEMCRIARRSGAPILFSNVAVNLKDCPPFASLHKEDMTRSGKKAWEEHYRQGTAFEAAGQYKQAIECYLAAEQIDETYADLQYRLGRSYWDGGDFEQAHFHFGQAREYDALRFRADAQINKTIRNVAEGREKQSVYFVDSVAAFEKASPHQTPGDELFYEHVHMNFNGNYTLAKALIPTITQILPASITQSARSVPSEEQVEKRLAYTDYERWFAADLLIKRQLSNPPFTNQLYHDEMMRRKTSEAKRLYEEGDSTACLKQYEAAIQAHPEDWRLVVAQFKIFNAMDVHLDLKAEEARIRKVLALCTYPPAYLGLGANLKKQGRLAEAKVVLNQLLELSPDMLQASYLLGEIAQQQHRPAEAIRHYRREISIGTGNLTPGSIPPYRRLAQVYSETGKKEKAIRVLNDAVGIFPESKETAPLYVQLGCLLYGKGEMGKALDDMETALRLNPDLAKLEEFTVQYNRMKGH